MANLYLCRHGDTEWSPVRRLAGRTDIALTADGEANATRIGKRLDGIAFDRVWSSPLSRARRTAELAGFADRAMIDARLAEIDFGDYEGKTSQDIRAQRPGWTYMLDGCPGGETVDQVGVRVDAFLHEVRPLPGTCLLFAHSVVLRILTARYLGMPPQAARHFMMSPAAISVLGYDPVDDAPAIAIWNDRDLPLSKRGASV
jgi:broad specificity phosphatase PhoE